MLKFTEGDLFIQSRYELIGVTEFRLNNRLPMRLSRPEIAVRRLIARRSG
jgi:hypothetical protein